MKTIKSRCKMAMPLVAGLLISFPTLTWAFSLGELADNIYAPTAFVTKFIVFGCYAVGIALALAGIMQFKNHQQNAKLVPLSTPITLFILAGILLILPFLSKQGGASWSAAEKLKQEQTSVPNTSPFSGKQRDNQPFQSSPSNPDAPVSNTPGETPPPAEPEDENRHWGTKPQYQH
jgi:hypothetical protein